MTQERDLQSKGPVRQENLEGQGVLNGFEPTVLSIREEGKVVVPLAFLAQREVEVALK